MNRIRKCIIHWLGGVTNEECNRDCCQSYKQGRVYGRQVVHTSLKMLLTIINGCGKQEWIDSVCAWHNDLGESIGKERKSNKNQVEL